MEKEQVDYAVLGLKALRRAARKVVEDARKNNLKIPIWRDGKVEYMSCDDVLEELWQAKDYYSLSDN